MQEMTEDARMKDNQLAAMLSRMDAKKKQMTDFITQVTTMSTWRRDDVNNDDDKTQQTRNPKRKVEDGGAGRERGSGDGGETINVRTNGRWTHPKDFGFP